MSLPLFVWAEDGTLRVTQFFLYKKDLYYVQLHDINEKGIVLKHCTFFFLVKFFPPALFPPSMGILSAVALPHGQGFQHCTLTLQHQTKQGLE